MEETDILKFIDKINSKMALKELLKMKNISNIFLTPNVLQNLKTIYNNLKEEKKNKYETLEIINRIVFDSIESEKLIDLSKKYINVITNYLQELEFANTYEIVLYYENLLKSGYLSKDMNFNYHNFVCDLYPKLWFSEARIASGTGVCRHITILLNNILYKMKIPNVPLVVKEFLEIPSSNLIEWLEKDNMFDHVVLGVLDTQSSQKYVYDATNDTFAFYNSDNILCIESNFKANYFIISKEHEVLKRELLSSCYYASTNATYNKELINSIRLKMKGICEKNQKYDIEFYKKNRDLFYELSEIEAKVCPHSDEEITSWNLTLNSKNGKYFK